jgi:micrococcal nuclease
MMRLSEFLRVLLKVAVTLSGVGVVALGLAPGGCGRVVAPQLANTVGLGDTVRASRVWRLQYPSTVPAMLHASVGSNWQTGKVTRVLDGDTYEVMVGPGPVRLRLLGVDAPETGQPYGRQASDSVRALLLGRYVLLQGHGVDLYGRTLGKVRLRPAAFSPTRLVALDSLQVARGWAWAFDPEHAHALREPQQLAAQAGRRGLWKCGTTGPVAPKTWRKMSQADKARAWVGCPW